MGAFLSFRRFTFENEVLQIFNLKIQLKISTVKLDQPRLRYKKISNKSHPANPISSNETENNYVSSQ
jgi:hypothetical protein